MGSYIECYRHLPDGSDPYCSPHSPDPRRAVCSRIHATRILGRGPARAAYMGRAAGPLQAGLDSRRREAILHRMQRPVRKRASYF